MGIVVLWQANENQSQKMLFTYKFGKPRHYSLVWQARHYSDNKLGFNTHPEDLWKRQIEKNKHEPLSLYIPLEKMYTYVCIL